MMALTIILIYALMMWIMSLILGIWSWDDEMDEFEWMMAAFWPLTIVICIVIALGFFFGWLWDKIPCLFREKIVSVFRALSIVFKPFQIGNMIKGWIQRKKDMKFMREKLENGNAVVQ